MIKKLLILLFFVGINIAGTFSIDLNYAPTKDNELNEYIDFINSYAPTDSAFIGLQRATNVFLVKNDYEKAIKFYQQYQDLFPSKKEFINKIIHILNKKDKKIDFVNLGPQINTDADEYTPVPTSDGYKFYFTTNKYFKDIGEEIFYTEKINDVWINSTRIEEPVRTARNESLLSISPDGNTLILFGNYPGKIGRGDIYYSEKVFSGWSIVKPYPRPINSEYFDCDASLVADNQAIIFVSDRPGGIGEYKPKDEYNLGSYWGNTDIYISVKNDTGWSNPINLGTVINTPLAERFPFLHPDMKTLYFCSEGHPGLGKLDIFRSVRLNENSWTQWSEPENVGKMINSGEDEANFVVSGSGETAYISSESIKGLGGKDIYSLKLPPNLRPSGIYQISGFILDSLGFYLDADIFWKDAKSGFILGKTKSNPQDGSYLIYLSYGKTYELIVKKSNYLDKVVNLTLPKSTFNNDTTINITMESAIKYYGKYTIDFIQALNNPVSSYFKLKSVKFKSGEFFISDDTTKNIAELDEFAEFLAYFDDTRIFLAGHADANGPAALNYKLSKERAQFVADYLIRKGINPNRFIVTGYGSKKPVKSNKTPQGRRLNRRVEYKLVR